MKIFLDTNIWLASLLTHGTCQELVEHCVESHALFTSDLVLEEIEEKLLEKFRFPPNRVQEILSFIRAHTVLVEASSPLTAVCRDPSDNQVLAAARTGKVACLVTGDQDLLVLKKFEGIPIIQPGQFWEFEKSTE